MMWGTKSHVQRTLRSHITLRVALTLIHKIIMTQCSSRKCMYSSFTGSPASGNSVPRCRSEDSVSVVIGVPMS